MKKLNFGVAFGEEASCQGNFVEIIDQGQTRGRFCNNEVPGDYVAEGNTLRIDVQGDARLVKVLRRKRTPFDISYCGVSSRFQSGYRPPSKDIVYEVNEVRARVPIPKNEDPVPFEVTIVDLDYRNEEDEDDKEVNNVAISGIVAIVLLIALFFVLIGLFIWWRRRNKRRI